ncbi:LuxR C-terminal-related transcriptional regulator [Streptomyces sp. enrichment culture]|uniref:LuxR C-terminal-related transcriptional regulator n=1 Tax=Streptomyces sp. enrichment culture TaxID=1795815 RepID=UPI003F564A49
MGLTHLGMTADQERLYRFLLRSPCAELDRARVELGIPDVAQVAAELRALGLIHGECTVATPAAAVDLLVRRRVEEAQRRLAELSVAWDVLAELAEEHRSGRSVQMVEHLTDAESVTSRIQALLDRRPGELAHLKTRPREPEATYDGSAFTRLLSLGLRSRTLVSAHVLHEPGQEDYARSLHALGDLHRVTDETFRHMAVVNRSVAFVQADPSDPWAGALQIRQPGLVTVLVEVFEGMWSRARDLDDMPLSAVERRVLHALTRHATDEAAARSINVSVRKFRAHVADLMRRLGANSRFQAALRAKERGWL